jgi:hypothetical protein
VVGYRSGLVGGFVALAVLGFAWKSGGYEPVSGLPPTVTTPQPNPPAPTPPPPPPGMAPPVGAEGPDITPVPADIRVSIPLKRGMFVSYWTSPIVGHWMHAGGSQRIGGPSERIPGLSLFLYSYDRSQEWFKRPSSRRGRVKILHETSVLKMSLGFVPLRPGERAKDFVFHFVIRGADYDTVLDSGTKVVHVLAPRTRRRHHHSIRRLPR